MTGLSSSLFSLRWRIVFFSTALILYGLASAPTPDHPGLIELIIGGALLLSIAPREWHALVSPSLRTDNGAFKLLLLYGVFIALPIGLIRGHDAILILRDLAGLLFLCLPLFYPRLSSSVLTPLCVFVALAFSLRLLGPALDLWAAPSELYYFAISPLVMFAAIYGIGTLAIAAYHRRLSIQTIVYGAAGLICVIAMMIDVQRATIGAVMIMLIILAIIGFIKAPKRMILPLLIAGIIFFAAQDIFLSVWQSMALKTSLVGLNMRVAEMQAVMDYLSADIGVFLFGSGWGSVFYSPAVDHLPVAFTHSLITYMLLKTGLIGAALCLVAITIILYRLGVLFFSSPLMSLSLSLSILIPVFFYASYKSLDFGLILVLSMIVSHRSAGLLNPDE